jgi:hypothetical protein
VVHVIAVLGLAAACVLWYLVQHWARPEGDPPCQERDPHCGACETHGPDCPSLPVNPSRASDPLRRVGEDRG